MKKEIISSMVKTVALIATFATIILALNASAFYLFWTKTNLDLLYFIAGFVVFGFVVNLIVIVTAMHLVDKYVDVQLRRIKVRYHLDKAQKHTDLQKAS